MGRHEINAVEWGLSETGSLCIVGFLSQAFAQNEAMNRITNFMIFIWISLFIIKTFYELNHQLQETNNSKNIDKKTIN